MIFRLSWICLLEDSFKILCVHEAHIQILWTSSYILTQMLMALCILSILVLESDTWYLQLCSVSRLLGLFRVHSNFRIVYFISGKITIAIWIGIILKVQTDLDNIDRCSSVTQVYPTLCKLQNARPPCSSQSPEVCPSSCPLYWWCHQPSHLLMPSYSSALNLSQHQGLFQWAGCSHQMPKILELQLQFQSSQWVFSVDFP